MRMESGYLVSAKTPQAIDRIITLWKDAGEKSDECSFENEAVDVLDVMADVIRLVHAMSVEGENEEFNIVGKCETDYNCVVF